MNEEWSQWLDFDSMNIEATPESPGVFVMHTSMKILFIGSSQNVRGELLGRLLDSCTGKSKRFRYIVTSSFEALREQLVKEYVDKHGNLPACMERNAL